MSSSFDEDELAPLPNSIDDSDDEIDWEEVQVPEQQSEPLLKIVLRPEDDDQSPAKKKSNAISYAERMLRIDCHKIHTVLLLINARIRNKWLNDELLHARLLSLTPLALQNSFAMIHPSRVPDAPLRGRMFENAVARLAEWWSETFFEITDEGHIRNSTFDYMKQRLGKYVPGFTEQFESAVAPPEPEPSPRKYNKPSTKGKEKERPSPDMNPLLDSNDLDLLEDILDNSIETIKSPKSLMKHALMQSGSRDTSAQLFTALCRALAIPARLVVSLQSVPWKATIGKEAKRYPKKVKGKQKEKDKEKVVEDDDVVPVPFDGAGSDQRLDGAPVEKKEKAKPPVKLRKGKSKAHVLGSASTSTKPTKVLHDNPRTTPPIFWTEVFSKADSRWIPVDPIRAFTNKRHVFDPSPSSSHATSSSSSSGDNRLVYIMAFEEDGYARDVTKRYAREFGAKVAKVQGASSSNAGKARLQWWEGVVRLVTRPFRLNRDDIEDEEFETAQLMEGMPTSIAGFKDHPLYVLPRHLKQHETIFPPPAPGGGSDSGLSTPYFGFGPARHTSFTPELGKFRGEPVYPRSSVVSLKTPENWLRSEGRSIKEGEVPMKYVKIRASTIGKRREVEMIKEGMKDAEEKKKMKGKGKADGPAGEKNDVLGIHVDELDGGDAAGAGGEIMQGSYARHQTELYTPDPVIDGIVPKNRFGNIDLYVESMLPRGAVHMPFKGIAKIARKLQIDFAEAVTGFEFRKRKATPMMEGIVVAIENEEMVLEAYLEAEREASEKARLKKEERVLKQWIRLVHGLRIRRRLQEQYADRLGTGESRGNITATVSSKTEGEKNQGDKDIDTAKRDEKTGNLEKQANGFTDLGHSEENGQELDISGGAGFLVEAGDVIQPFRLPKLPQLDNDLAERTTSAVRNRARQSNSKSSLDLTGNGAVPVPDFATYDVDVMAMDVDGALTSVTSAIASTEAGAQFIPKTMQELAAHADDAGLIASTFDLDSGEIEVEDISEAPEPRPARSTRNKRGSIGTGSTKSKRARNTTTENPKPVAISTTTRRRSSRLTRKRRRGDHEEEDEDECEPGVNADSQEEKYSPVKRTRRSKLSAVETKTETPPSTRVLRSRAKISETQLDKEREKEEAYYVEGN